MNKEDIYRFLQSIPKGKVVSYKFLAQKFHTHPRSIGSILRSNTQPEHFPCYKVITSNGSLGGYNGGIEKKIQRLQADGVSITNGKVDKEHLRNGE